jgi:hypothetical protein
MTCVKGIAQMQILVLVVEPDRETHAKVRMVCEHRRCVPVTARDATTARRIAAADRPDIIVCAPALVADLRQIVPAAMIVALGGDCAEADHALPLPLDAAVLGDLIDAWAERSTAPRPS